MPVFFIRILVLVFLMMFIKGAHLPVSNNEEIFVLKGKAQGTSYSIKYVHDGLKINANHIDSLFVVFDRSLSRYNKYSLLSKLNSTKRKVKLDEHLHAVLIQAINFQSITNGCFEYRLLPLMRLWGFTAKEINGEPDSISIKKLLYLSLSNKLLINNMEVIKSSDNLGIDLDGIAQGYCVDQLAKFIKSKGVNNFIVELGGEVFVSGKGAKGENWRVGLTDVYQGQHREGGRYYLTGLDQHGLTSSGNFQQFRKIKDKYYSHIIDPRTGFPVTNGIVNVTVLAPTATEADALDNAFMVMGREESFNWVRQHPHIGLHMTYFNERGELTDTANSYFKNFLVEEKD